LGLTFQFELAGRQIDAKTDDCAGSAYKQDSITRLLRGDDSGGLARWQQTLL